MTSFVCVQYVHESIPKQREQTSSKIKRKTQANCNNTKRTGKNEKLTKQKRRRKQKKTNTKQIKKEEKMAIETNLE